MTIKDPNYPLLYYCAIKLDTDARLILRPPTFMNQSARPSRSSQGSSNLPTQPIAPPTATLPTAPRICLTYCQRESSRRMTLVALSCLMGPESCDQERNP
ncbi:hypothetical protein SERLA73DRAFT_179855 [Serpula lacrymans var. lacrymans S7.3]|uniref:Uncharacterized protein n=1 Tax=Serpula lacrymans var. lacrymans (strain S7.3) TaxID=936435 RepID=F8PUU6_SERL3|nr:hypothetical protein SERLA73DRAFT_179855 [Serpula lacrymans var. lacrymans S7.3]